MNLKAIAFDPAGFTAWQQRTQIQYAASKVASGSWAEDGALERARWEHETLLSQGASTPGHVIRQVVDADDENPIGMFWIGPATEAPPDTGWLFEIEIAPEYRGRGLGREVMAMAERSARQLGYSRLGLHVFGDNTVARKLYKSCGYRLTSLCLAKDIPPKD